MSAKSAFAGSLSTPWSKQLAAPMLQTEVEPDDNVVEGLPEALVTLEADQIERSIEVSVPPLE